MTKLFCVNCGIRTENAFLAVGSYALSCRECNLMAKVTIIKESDKTFTEVQKEFVQTQLTENQQFGKKKKK